MTIFANIAQFFPNMPNGTGGVTTTQAAATTNNSQLLSSVFNIGAKEKLGVSNYLQYPSNIGSDEYPHYVMFFINVNSKSTYAPTNSETNYSLDLDKIHSNSGMTSTGAISTSTGMFNSFIQTVANSTVDAGLVDKETKEKYVNAADKVGRSYKRLQKAIALYMPPQMSVNYQANYEEVSAGLLGKALLGAGEDIKNLAANGELMSAEALKKIVVGSAPELLTRDTIGQANDLASGLGMGLWQGDSQAAIGGLTGKVDNPRSENLFKNIGFRSHQFEFNFLPKTQSESETVKSIIQTFKTHMHPEIQSDGGKLNPSFLITPSEFDIQFYYKGVENEEVHKISTCVLENMSVDYAGTGSWVAFAGTGTPVNIKLTLQFKEVELLVRQMVEKGY